MSFQFRDFISRKETDTRSRRARALTNDRSETPKPTKHYTDNRIIGPIDETDDDVRGSLRRRVEIRAEIREAGGGRYDIWVSDMSQTGFRMQLLCHIETQRDVLLIMPGMKPLRARIAWHKGNYYGCMFDHPLHVAVFDHIARQFSQG